jgi:hypothetical protein
MATGQPDVLTLEFLKTKGDIWWSSCCRGPCERSTKTVSRSSSRESALERLRKTMHLTRIAPECSNCSRPSHVAAVTVDGASPNPDRFQTLGDQTDVSLPRLQGS